MAAIADQAAVAVVQQPPAGVIPRAQSTSLYVGDLSPEVNEAILYDVFNAIGPVASIRVCRDAITRRSLGYAYVNFQSPTDAERALDTTNFTPILGRPCRIMWCQRDPSLRRSGLGNIFIKGLEKTIDNKELYDAFSVFGNISSCKIVYDDKNESVGRGFVQFETAQSAETAIAETNGTLLKEKKITVALFKSKKDRMDEYSRTEHQFRNVYINNLTDDFDDVQLFNLFSQFGAITSHKVMFGANGDPAKSRNFGFVNFENPADAKNAVEQLNGKELNGKTVYAGRAMKKHERASLLNQQNAARRRDMQERTKGVNLYVKNLTEGFGEEALRELFSSFGPITSSKIMRDERGNERGFGFVCFSEQADAAKAVAEMNGRIQNNKPLYVALAQHRDERRQALAQQHRQRLMMARGNPGVPPFMQGMYPQMMYAQNPYQQARGGFGQMPFNRFPMQARGYPGQPPFYPQNPYAQPQQRFGPQQPFPRQNRPNQRGPGFQGQPGAPALPGQPQGRRQQQPGQAGPQGATRYNNQRGPQNGAGDAQPAVPASQAQQLASLIAAAEPENQKQILGDNLYQIISGFYPQQAGKLTGMLLQMDNGDLLHLLEDSAALRAEVDKANEVLTSHASNQ